MKLYRGSSSENFEVKKHVRSRYGFNALFFTTSLELARLYAHHLAREKRNWKGGFVYEFEIPEPYKKINYEGAITHSSHFRNLMFKLYREDLKSAIIENCYDYPSKELVRYINSEVVVVFDLDLIKQFKLIESNVKL